MQCFNRPFDSLNYSRNQLLQSDTNSAAPPHYNKYCFIGMQEHQLAIGIAIYLLSMGGMNCDFVVLYSTLKGACDHSWRP